MRQVTIKAARVNRELTQAEMAEKLGVSLSVYQDIENGVRAIKPLELYAFCHITNIPEAEIRLPIEAAKLNKTEENAIRYIQSSKQFKMFSESSK